MKKSFLILLCALLCLGTQAAKKTKKGKKADVVKVDTIDSRTFAYLLGYVNTQGLKPYLVQQKGVDTTYMAQFLDGFAVRELTPEDKSFKARIVGTEIRQDVESRPERSGSLSYQQRGAFLPRFRPSQGTNRKQPPLSVHFP